MNVSAAAAIARPQPPAPCFRLRRSRMRSSAALRGRAHRPFCGNARPFRVIRFPGPPLIPRWPRDYDAPSPRVCPSPNPVCDPLPPSPHLPPVTSSTSRRST